VCLKYPFRGDPAFVRVAESIAHRIWGRDVQGKTWPYLLFLNDLKQVDIPLGRFNELTGYRFNAIQGFMVLKRERSERLLEELSGLSESGVVEAITRPSVRAEAENLHDTIVERLFAIGELIGYNRTRTGALRTIATMLCGSGRPEGCQGACSRSRSGGTSAKRWAG